MKTRIIVISAIGCLIAMTGMQNAQAQMVNNPDSLLSSPAGSIVQPLKETGPQGTDELQEKVLMQINDGLINGWLSAADASQYKNQLNKLSEQESWYESLSTPIPAAVTEKDRMLLNQMSQKLKSKPQLSASAGTVLHADVDSLIGNALARNHISSGEAATYYLRLAQIESNLESTRRSQGGSSDQEAAMSKSLGELKSELMRKVN